jgi:hypothetical protein
MGTSTDETADNFNEFPRADIPVAGPEYAES